MRFVPRLLLMIFVASAGGLFFLALVTRPDLLTVRDAPRRCGRLVAAVFCAMLIMNGLSPYLGLKTQTAFSMFSNLRTEGGLTNHLFMPLDLMVSNTTLNLVTVESSNSRWLQKTVNAGDLVPFFELRRAASLDPSSNFEVVYTPLGMDAPVHAARQGPTDRAGAAVFDEPSLLQQKLLWFRSGRPLDEPVTCRH